MMKSVFLLLILLSGGIIFKSQKKYPSGSIQTFDLKQEGFTIHKATHPELKIHFVGNFDCPFSMISMQNLLQLLARKKVKYEFTIQFYHMPKSFNEHDLLISLLWQLKDYAKTDWFNFLYQNHAILSSVNAHELLQQKVDSSIDIQQFINTPNLALWNSFYELKNLGINNLPTIFINHKMYTGTLTVQQWEELINDEVNFN